MAYGFGAFLEYLKAAQRLERRRQRDTLNLLRAAQADAKSFKRICSELANE